MKVIVNVCRGIVAVLFIFSGLVKANDPLGLSYKMQEFFDIWGLSAFNNFSLAIAVVIIAFEIVAGVALLLGWKAHLISWLLLLLIVFFTFLTGYAYLSGKFKSCGCFGDCIPITSGMSFAKDIVLLLLIIFLSINKKYIRPLLPKAITVVLMLLTVFCSVAAQWYCLRYQPVADCLPFKKGNNIALLRTMPNNAVPDSTVITFVYEKNGKKVEFSADHFPEDFSEDTYTFINRYDKVIKEGSNNTPPIKSFILYDVDGADKTSDILNAEKVLLLFVENADRPLQEWVQKFETLYKAALEKNVPVYLITSKRQEVKAALSHTSVKDMAILDADATMIKTAARVNPTVYVLQRSVIAGKWSDAQWSDALHFLQAHAPVSGPVSAPGSQPAATNTMSY